MCGLLGLLTSNASAEDVVDAVGHASHCMRHRGPDEPGTWHDDDLALGFNRLSIIDIEHSHQPLRWGPEESPERYALVFNGEIYNYLELRETLAREHGATFATEGDGEAILAAFHFWGDDAVRRLRGMFAFALWDTDKRELFLARDPFGIKPLFYSTGAAGTAFASEKKSILELLESLGVSDELDPRALEHYTVLQYVPEPETLHKGIRRLESGCTARLTPSSEPTVTRYFRPTFPVRPVPSGTEAARYREIAEALEDSVAKHMRADVTVGSFLSGGIDSTAIAALAMRHNPDLVTFTTGFEREGYSEVDVAAESAAAIGAKHVIKVVGPEEFAAAIPEIVWYLDDPVADPALVPLYFVAKEARKHVKVVLSGEGADELFGGYTIYREPLSLAPFEKLPPSLRRAAGRLSERIPEGTRGKSLLHRGSMSLEERYYGNARSFNDAQLRSVLREFRPEWTHQDVTAPIYAQSVGWDPVARMQHLDLFTWLRGDILVKADKITMANSLELRVPFLDNEVFRVAEQLPLEQKITKSTTKYALRKALDGIVPDHVLNRAKLGFPVPLRHWLRGTELFDWAHQQIADSQTDHLLDKAAITRMLNDHREGRSDHSRRLWTVLIFMVWHGIFVEKRIVPAIAEPTYPVRL
ncbi:asparagine synthase (glutamine-hydrolyzing) [Rhodococcus sp. BP-349]|uniref:asparagine synthase (glutamine-hydrolyzing) n=1 Tax=unclassified Rhodococcus (in: high G+C Gram-positive bacteria) TaxID=192944 RepID=UPI001C9ADC6B|nr:MULTISPECIES: asparagine synthase (glutamine-hydrolyzing) [unclassified Rhodococcus (in: high G+C Gram-positive bacteria)]MBY6540697.1 asparagine synthase (glutamine-hydrolyzing) [Rhodococcus sp. BP-363]MBY6545278.1 asparagine synthase (glutamine-hydrolyzing) [Rhodococcus sp. BP-369]MBY6564508.1 asparagine synthase (glutamine-hydrolyzing) [Rhodococcus sp. BP-370]MBY6578556.1 asparagine synthase (glutamine-hydrolyzing) [Rhodococcus sp. BP-364]MBY6587857.1 asparagine synthase (glutamine-hydro